MMMRLHKTTLFAVKIIDFPVFDESVADGPTDGRTDGRTDRPTDKVSYRDADPSKNTRENALNIKAIKHIIRYETWNDK